MTFKANFCQTSGIMCVFICVFFLLFILFFLISLISHGPFHPDCLYFAIQAEKTASTGTIHYLHSHGFPLTAVLGALFVRGGQLLGAKDPVMCVNAMSVVFASLCLPVLFLLIRKVTDAMTAAVAVMLFALSPIYLSNSVYGNSHMPALFFLLGGLLLIAAGKKDERTTPIYMAGIMLGLAAAARLQEVVAALPVILIFIFFKIRDDVPSEKKKQLCSCRILLSIMMPAILITALFYHAMPRSSQALGLGDMAVNYLIKYPVSYLGPWPATFRIAMRHLTVNFSWMGITLTSLGFFLLFKKHKDVFGLLLTWLVTGFLMNASLRLNVPRFFLFTTIPFYIAQAFLMTSFKAYKKFFVTAFAILLLVMGDRLSYIYPIVRYRHQHNLIADYMRWVAQNTESQARIIFPDARLFLSYYGQRTTLGRPLHLEVSGGSELKAFQSEIQRLHDQKIPVYITASGLVSYNPQNMFSDFMSAHYRLEWVGVHAIEDWHRGEIYRQVGPEGLFRVVPLEP